VRGTGCGRGLKSGNDDHWFAAVRAWLRSGLGFAQAVRQTALGRTRAFGGSLAFGGEQGLDLIEAGDEFTLTTWCAIAGCPA